MARITVLMPVYNGMPYIPQAVESVLSQSETDWELIISDNGSTDGTRDYLRTLTDPRIRVHYQDSNLASLAISTSCCSSPVPTLPQDPLRG